MHTCTAQHKVRHDTKRCSNEELKIPTDTEDFGDTERALNKPLSSPFRYISVLATLKIQNLPTDEHIVLQVVLQRRAAH